MTKYEAVDCQGFAGGFTMGTHQAGFDVIAKREMEGGFGAESVLAQKHIFGEIDYEEAEWQSWTPRDVPYVFGNPPCSGFSNLTRSSFRGMDSPINSCMWAFVEYVSKCNPEVAVFESVQGAFRKGRPLMQALREKLEQLTGDNWDLWHVLHNGYVLGGPSIRKRYFFVVSRIPLGFETPPLDRVPMFGETICDLEGMDYEKVGDQPYGGEASWWVKEQGLQREDGLVDGHSILDVPMVKRVRGFMKYTDWENREVLADIVKRVYEAHDGQFPADLVDDVVQRWPEKDYRLGYNQPIRWDPDRAGRVVTGSGMHIVVHPFEPRTITLREAYRLQGFPDEWRLEPAVQMADDGRRDGFRQAAPWPGKGIPVQAGKWMSGWVKRALDGEPGDWRGEVVGDRERVIDFTHDYKKLYDPRRGEFRDARNKDIKEAMANRPA